MNLHDRRSCRSPPPACSITQNGVGRFQLESAQISGHLRPEEPGAGAALALLEDRREPGGISMDDPFELPARIKEIRVGRGEALVVQ